MLAAVLESVPTTYAIEVQLADGGVVQLGNALPPAARDEVASETRRTVPLHPVRR